MFATDGVRVCDDGVMCWGVDEEDDAGRDG